MQVCLSIDNVGVAATSLPVVEPVQAFQLIKPLLHVTAIALPVNDIIGVPFWVTEILTAPTRLPYATLPCQTPTRSNGISVQVAPRSTPPMVTLNVIR